MKRARLAARVELEPLQAAFGQANWDHAVGTSGTIRAVGDIIEARGGSNSLITSGRHRVPGRCGAQGGDARAICVCPA